MRFLWLMHVRRSLRVSDTFHVDPPHSRDSVGRRVQKQCLINRVYWAQLGGRVTNPEDPFTVVSDRGGKARHVRQGRLVTVSDRTEWRATLEESWIPTTLALVMRNEKSRSHLAYLARDQPRRGGRVVVTFPWTWDVLATWPIQSVLTEAPFLCPREGRKGILTKCADTARLVDRSRCCKSPFLDVWCSHPSQTCLHHIECVCGACQSRKIPWTAAILPTSMRPQPSQQRRTM